jgi:copper chaperone
LRPQDRDRSNGKDTEIPHSTHVFRVDGMHGSICALLIADALADLPGISTSHTEAGSSTVQLDTALTSPREVMDTITRLGYSVDMAIDAGVDHVSPAASAALKGQWHRRR